MSKLFVRLGIFRSVLLLTVFSVFVSLMVTPTVLYITKEKITVGSYLIATITSLIIAPSISSLFIKQFFKIHELEQDIRQIAMFDDMTGFMTRRFFLQHAESYVTKANRANDDFSVMVLDVDFFKHINDEYGHMAGDKVLSDFGELCLKHKREEDIFGRTGGEEFTLVLPNMNASDAKNYAEKLREDIENLDIEFDQFIIRCTISIGFVSCFSSKRELNALVKIADEAMYQAKKSGRNRSVQGFMTT